MKKLFLFIVAFFAVSTIWAYDFQSGDLYYNIITTEPYAVKVTYQSSYSQSNYSGLTTATIPETVDYNGITYTVTSIGEGAFRWCSSLTSITIPKTIKVIENNAFTNCYNLTKTNYTGTIASWCDIKFNYSNPIENSGNFFINDQEIKDITIPNTVDSIPYMAFRGCSSLISVSISEGVVSIGKEAFMECYNLQSVTIPNSITHIGRNAFFRTDIYSKNMEDDILYIDNCLICARWQDFYYEERSIIVKNNTRLIADEAFADCISLTAMVLPESVTSIGQEAFSNCSSLNSITIPNNLTSIGSEAFDDTPWYENLEDGLLYMGRVLYKYKGTMPPNTSIQINDGTICINENAFYNCSSLASITIPNSVKSIGDEAFYNCESLTKTNYTGDVASWCNIKFDDVFSNPICFSGNFYINDELVKDLVIPNTVDSIHNYAFCFCSSLTSVTIPNSVTNIGDFAFFGCDKTTSVTIPNSVTSIGSSAFRSCSSLTSITIPNSVTSIGNQTFYYCSSLASITIGNSVTSIGARAFAMNSSLTSIIIPNRVVYIGEEAFENCSSITSITIGNGVKSIAVRAFAGCSAITKVNYTGNIADWCKIQFAGFFANPFQMSDNYYTHSMTTLYLNGQAFDGIFPNNVDTISEYAFCGASFENHSITIGDNVKYIGNYAFEGSTNLERVYLPTTPPKLGENVFTTRHKYATFGISSFYLPCGLQKIYDSSDWKNYTNDYTKFSLYTKLMHSGYCGDSLNLSWSYAAEKLTITGKGEYKPYYNCTPWELLIDSIKTLEIGQGITSISDYAFDDLINLNTLILPNSIEKIGAKAFNTCKKLYDIYCYAQFPPETSNNTFVNYNAFLHVPCDYQRYYTADMVFSKFINVECISAETISTDSIIVSPSFNDVVFTWPTESNAGSYTLTINKGGEVFCTLTFNAAGQLTGIAFAPSRNGQRHAPAATQAANGFTFTITGLDEGTDYSYNFVIKDNSGKTLQTYSGEFRTQSTSDRTVTVEYDATQGQVTGAGVYQIGDTVTLTAIPNDGYRFVRWSNDVEDNPYSFVISENVMLSAEFEIEKTAVENISSPTTNCQKIIRDNQLLILRDDKTYNIVGQIVE